jgi:hypothetical protein
MEEHRLEIINRHLLVHLNAQLALIDTGSPGDIGRGHALTLLGKMWTPPSRQVHVLEAVSNHLGCHVEWLLGHDTLAACCLLLDWSRELAVFSMSGLECAAATSIPIELLAGVPLVALHQSAGAAAVAVLDSGAALSYAPEAAVQGTDPGRREWDFYPLLGPFETDVWRLPIVVGTRKVEMQAGVLPEALCGSLGRISGGWILGSDFFRDRAVMLDYPSRRVLDAPGGSPFFEIQ